MKNFSKLNILRFCTVINGNDFFKWIFQQGPVSTSKDCSDKTVKQIVLKVWWNFIAFPREMLAWQKNLQKEGWKLNWVYTAKKGT